MLSYTTPATIARNNAEAARVMKDKGYDLPNHGTDRAIASKLAAKHETALAARKAG